MSASPSVAFETAFVSVASGSSGGIVKQVVAVVVISLTSFSHSIRFRMAGR